MRPQSCELLTLAWRYSTCLLLQFFFSLQIIFFPLITKWVAQDRNSIRDQGPRKRTSHLPKPSSSMFPLFQHRDSHKSLAEMVSVAVRLYLCSTFSPRRANVVCVKFPLHLLSESRGRVVLWSYVNLCRLRLSPLLSMRDTVKFRCISWFNSRTFEASGTFGRLILELGY